jgi:predicted dienelactone hydrolase
MRLGRLRIAAAYATVLLSATGCALHGAPRPPLVGSESAGWLAPGPYRVASARVVFHDRARRRTLVTRLWWPAQALGSAPLVVQVHGFLSSRAGGTYVARHLASHGYVVVAATHPTTTLLAPGGAKLADVVRQPGDVTFLIDRMLARDPRLPPVPTLDPARIAVMGHSLGGLTATLTAFHPRLRDPRIAAAISIAGPMALFEPRFFRGAAVPFLMIAGSADVVVDYRRNAFVALDRVPGGTLVLIGGASHAGFDHEAARLPRFVANPDVFACWILARTVDLDVAVATVRGLFRADDGIDLERMATPCLEKPPRLVMRPAQQQMITTLAVTAFLESRFASEQTAPTRARRYLTTMLPREVDDVSVATADEHLPLSAHTGKWPNRRSRGLVPEDFRHDASAPRSVDSCGRSWDGNRDGDADPGSQSLRRSPS